MSEESEPGSVDWVLIGMLVFTTLVGFLFGINTVLRVERPKREALEAELRRCERGTVARGSWEHDTEIIESCFRLGRHYGCWRSDTVPTYYPPDSGIFYQLVPPPHRGTDL